MADRSTTLGELVFEYLERSEAEGAGVLDELVTRHPELADDLKTRVQILVGTGLASAGMADAPAERLGDFRLLEKIGGGGMGVVYKALDEALGRVVALKLVRPGELLFPGSRERFRREVETVARLAHPGIVPIYSTGEKDGVPFFAMECIEGCTLAEVIGKWKHAGRSPADVSGKDFAAAVAELSDVEPTEDSSPLFEGSWNDVCAKVVREVAEALEHAHRRGTLHRDVKPSNIMVTPSGRVVLVDFGLSFARGSERITQAGSALGSVGYMSPEQFDGEFDTLDARADVYSLGVTLYQLLTFELPYRAESQTALLEAIRAGSPEPVRKVNPRVSWELETVTLKAMEARREARYESCAAFATDLTATLTGSPIAARRAGFVRRTSRWFVRHPARSVFIAMLALIVVVGPLVFGWQQRQARNAAEEQNRVITRQRGKLRDTNAELNATLEQLQAALTDAREQRDRATAESTRAQVNFQRAVRAVDTMLTRVAESELRDVPGLLQLRASVLEDALAFYLELLEEPEAGTDLRREAARAWRRVGDLQGLLDRSAEATASIEKSLDVLLALRDETAADAGLLSESAATRQSLILVLRELGRHAEAQEQSELAIEELTEAVRLSPGNTSYASNLATVRTNRARVAREQGRDAEARAMLEELLPEMERVHELEPDDLGRRERLARVHQMLGVLWIEKQSVTVEARTQAMRTGEKHHARSLSLLEPVVAARPNDVELRRDFARAHINLGGAILGRQALQEAIEPLERGAELARQLCEDFPGVDTFREDAGTVHMLLGSARAAAGQYEAGVQLINEAAESFKALTRSEGNAAAAWRKLAGAQLQVGMLHWHVGGDADAALAALEQSIETHRRAVSLSPGMPQPAAGLDWGFDLTNLILLELGDALAAGNAALEWSDVVFDPTRKLVVAARLARGATSLETGSEWDEDDVRNAELFDEKALELVEQALAARISPSVLDPIDLQALQARPWAGVLGE